MSKKWTFALLLGLSTVGCGSEQAPGSQADGMGGAAGAAAITAEECQVIPSEDDLDDGEGPDGSDANDHFPLVDGAVREYFHSSNDGWEETVTLEALRSNVFLERDTENPDGVRTESILALTTSGRVLRTSKVVYQDDALDFCVTYDPGFVRFDPAWLELPVGDSVREEYERTETNQDGEKDPTRERAHTYTSFGLESTTIAGTLYNDTLVIERKRDYEDVQGQPEDQQKLFRFAPGVGKVQEVNFESGNSEELLSYEH